MESAITIPMARYEALVKKEVMLDTILTSDNPEIILTEKPEVPTEGNK